MRRLVYALSLTTLTFALSTAYFARKSYLERERCEAGAVLAASAQAPAGTIADTMPAPQIATRPLQDAPACAKTEPAVNVVSQASPDPVKQLAELTDPAQRRKLLEQRKATFRMVHPGLAEHLHLDDNGFERFIDLIARQELDMMEASVRCWLDESCRPRGIDPSGLRDAQKREVADLFGTQTQEAFDFYRFTGGERRTAKELRSRLPDKHRLSDSQTQALVVALHEEQQRVDRDRRQRYLNVSLFNGLIYTPVHDAPPGEDGAQAAAEYTRMLHDRAGSVLTSEQLAEFERMQKEALKMYESTLLQTGS